MRRCGPSCGWPMRSFRRKSGRKSSRKSSHGCRAPAAVRAFRHGGPVRKNFPSAGSGPGRGRLFCRPLCAGGFHPRPDPRLFLPGADVPLCGGCGGSPPGAAVGPAVCGRGPVGAACPARLARHFAGSRRHGLCACTGPGEPRRRCAARGSARGAHSLGGRPQGQPHVCVP